MDYYDTSVPVSETTSGVFRRFCCRAVGASGREGHADAVGNGTPRVKETKEFQARVDCKYSYSGRLWMIFLMQRHSQKGGYSGWKMARDVLVAMKRSPERSCLPRNFNAKSCLISLTRGWKLEVGTTGV